MPDCAATTNSQHGHGAPNLEANQEKHGAHQRQEGHPQYLGHKGSIFGSQSGPSWLKRDTVPVAKQAHMVGMRPVTKKGKGAMGKRMDGDNHMMKTDEVGIQVENKLKKRKTKIGKVPLLMGLGLPVLRKRFLNSFQVQMMIIRLMMTLADNDYDDTGRL